MSEKSKLPLSRRSFMQWAGIAGAGAMGTGLAQHAIAESEEERVRFVPEGAVAVKLNINDKDYKLKLDPRTSLLDCLRENLNLTGTKKGCDHGQCGACTIHINGRRSVSCLSLAVMHEGDQITTIEGIGTPEAPHAMQTAFMVKDAFQCGYCTPGQIMSACALLKEKCGQDDASVREAMSGNICRCGAYKNILSAIQSVRGNERTAEL